MGDGKSISYKFFNKPRNVVDMKDYCRKNEVGCMALEVVEGSSPMLTYISGNVKSTTSLATQMVKIYNYSVVLRADDKKVSLKTYSGIMEDRMSARASALSLAFSVKKELDASGFETGNVVVPSETSS